MQELAFFLTKRSEFDMAGSTVKMRSAKDQDALLECCCAVCTIATDFSNFEQHLNKNEFNKKFLSSNYTGLASALFDGNFLFE